MEGKYFIIPYHQILHSFNGLAISSSLLTTHQKLSFCMVILLSFVTKTLGMLSEKLIFRLHFPSLQKTRCLFKYSYLSQNCFRTKRNVVVIHGIRLDDIHYKHFLLISNVNFIQKFMVMITNDRCIITHSFCFFPKITQH